MSKPFIDSFGTRGSSFVRSVSRSIKHGSAIRFQLFSDTQVELIIPGRGKNPKINNDDALRLAHWILDNCRPLVKK